MKASIVAVTSATALLGLSLFAAVEPGHAADPTPVDLVNALNALFGKPQGTRSAHSKGFCLTGQFAPAPDATSSP